MADIDLRMILRPYDQLCPLMNGQFTVPGVRLYYDIETPLTVNFPDAINAAEVSFTRYTQTYARGDGDLVGLPAFILRGFRHRNFFVRRDSPLQSLADLKNRRLGTDSWPDTGTLWARAAMRDAGVMINDVSWVVGPLDVDTPSKSKRPGDAIPPPGTEYLPAGGSLMTALHEGRIDALTTAFAPDAVFQPDGPVRRLVPNYCEVEADYHRRLGVYPGFHIIAFRRSFAERHPEIVVGLYGALQDSWRIWTSKAKKFAEASPWQMAELETIYRDFSGDALPFGMESPSHQRMVATICHEQHAQGLVPVAANPAALFADFERINLAVAA